MLEGLGEDILFPAIVVLYERVKFYNLRYYDESGNFKAVRFVSYIWKFIDGLILASLKQELRYERTHHQPDWGRLLTQPEAELVEV
jgi:hypothetical protein